jgi:hypothetical protein
MTCDRFRSELPASADEPLLLAHLRECDDCMNWVADESPELLFRALGGDELVPPGGVDGFVAGVMQQVELSNLQRQIRPARRASRWSGWAAAALFALATATFAIREVVNTPNELSVPAIAMDLEAAASFHRPIIEHYANAAAMIVEVPTSESEDFKLVMIFDDSLPVDL